VAFAGLALSARTAPAQVFEVSEGTIRQVDNLRPQAAMRVSAVRPHLTAAVEAAAAKYHLAPELVDAIARAESNYRVGAVSPAGAVGVMQLMPATARALGVDPRKPDDNIFGGAAYLRALLDQFDGHLDLALAAYNAGPRSVARYAGVPPYRETRAYVANNLNALAQRSLAAPSAFNPSGEP
jgi:soluble lytic murein transglycosylase-like protein